MRRRARSRRREAYAAKRDGAAARGELARLRALAARVPTDMIIILNRATSLLELASEVLAGWIAAEEERMGAAVVHLEKAARLEDALTYDEPPPWYHPVRNMLGQVLLRAGRPAEAEAAFREDLGFVRENGWSLAGLQQALLAQGRTAEAAAVGKRVVEAWRYADVPPSLP